MAMKLDLTDVKIINLLMDDGRMSVAEIARRMDDSTERTAHYRVEKLIQSGVIRIGTIVDPRSLGFAVRADIFMQVEPGRIQEVAEKLTEFAQVSFVACSLGEYDVVITVSTRDNTELYTFLAEEIVNVPGIKDTTTVLVPKFLKDVHHWFHTELDTEEIGFNLIKGYPDRSSQVTNHKVDRVDQAIVDFLIKDGRIPAVKIARQIGYVSARLVRDRIDTLVQNKVIQMCAIVDSRKLGFPIIAGVVLDVDKRYIMDTAQRLAKLPETNYVGFSLEKPKLSIQVYARDNIHLYTFVTEEIPKLPGVTNTVTSILPKILKDLDEWRIPDSACVDYSVNSD